MTRDCLTCRHAGKPTRSAECRDCEPPEWAGYMPADATMPTGRTERPLEGARGHKRRSLDANGGKRAWRRAQRIERILADGLGYGE